MKKTIHVVKRLVMAEYILSKTAETTDNKKQESRKMYVSVPFNRVQAVEELRTVLKKFLKKN